MTGTKELGKYEIIPTREQLNAIVQYFRTYANEKGRINFTVRQVFENPIIAEHFGSISFINGILTYLTNERYLEKVYTGQRGIPSTWDATYLIKHPEDVITREEAGRSRPIRDEQMNLVLPENVEIEVSHKREEPQAKIQVEPQVQIMQPAKESNAEILAQLRETMKEMAGYLQNLPIEMGGHLRSISDKLDTTDETVITSLRSQNHKLVEENEAIQKQVDDLTNDLENASKEKEELSKEKSIWNEQKKDLSLEVQRLQNQLEEVGRNSNYNKHQVYRQRNLIMDEVDRMINSPAWTIRQNSVSYRNSIETKLNEIMKEVGIDTAE